MFIEDVTNAANRNKLNHHYSLRMFVKYWHISIDSVVTLLCGVSIFQTLRLPIVRQQLTTGEQARTQQNVTTTDVLVVNVSNPAVPATNSSFVSRDLV